MKILLNLLSNIKLSKLIYFILPIQMICFLLFFGCERIKKNKYKDLFDGYKQLYNAEQKKAQVWQDEAGKWRAKQEATELSVNTIKDLIKNNDEKLLKIQSEFPELKKNMRNLDTYIKSAFKDTLIIKVPLHDTTFVTVNGDTIKGKKGIYKDSWSDCIGLVYNDSLQVNCVTKDSISTVVYWKRKWFLAKKVYHIEFKNANPNNKPTFSENIVVRKKR
jgi:hypothetical protein